MYYPLLRGRQFELIALRELATENATQKFIRPIIEPVKESTNNFELAYKIFLEKEQPVFVIVNPIFGAHTGDHEYYLEQMISDHDSRIVSPAFYFDNNAEYITQMINDHHLTNCMVIGKSDIQNDNSDFTTLISRPEITHITISNPDKNRELKRFIMNLHKIIIRLDDPFEKLSTNSDYLPVPAHLFTEENKYYTEDRYQGFADYTVLSNSYSESGGLPKAVVIHLTYLTHNNQIWISHFTSDTNATQSDIQGKFAEAAKKAVDFCETQDLSNTAISELRQDYNDFHYPGLGVVKKISIKNHLLVIADYFQTQELS